MVSDQLMLRAMAGDIDGAKLGEVLWGMAPTLPSESALPLPRFIAKALGFPVVPPAAPAQPVEVPVPPAQPPQETPPQETPSAAAPAAPAQAAPAVQPATATFQPAAAVQVRAVTGRRAIQILRGIEPRRLR
jgi:hypothetical protein